MIQLRPYQEACIAGLRAAFKSGYHSPLLVSPTGSGKTVMFSFLTGALIKNRKRVALLCHREELVDQISRTLGEFGVGHGFVTAGALYDARKPAHVASVMTLARRMDRVEVPDYVICDEAHHCIAGSTWGKIIEAWRALNPALRVIGVTATPQRLDGAGLGDMFDEMIMGPSVRSLIDAGALAEFRLFAPSSQVDLTGVRMVAGEFNRGQLAGAIDKPAITGSAVGEYRARIDGLPSVAFCVSIEHANHVAEQFRAAGYRSACIDGKMDKVLRRSIVHDFGRGAINVLTSCDIISEGFDIPGIVGCIGLRPTQSLSMCLQQWGRSLRTAPGKEFAFIHDHVGNSRAREDGGQGHGLPDDERNWSLLGNKRKAKDGETSPGARQCEKCFAMSPAAARVCRDCGAEFPVNARIIEEVAGTLSEIDVARAKRQAQVDQAKTETLEGLMALAGLRGYSNPEGWARHVIAGREKKRLR